MKKSLVGNLIGELNRLTRPALMNEHILICHLCSLSSSCNLTLIKIRSNPTRQGVFKLLQDDQIAQHLKVKHLRLHTNNWMIRQLPHKLHMWLISPLFPCPKTLAIRLWDQLVRLQYRSLDWFPCEVTAQRHLVCFLCQHALQQQCSVRIWPAGSLSLNLGRRRRLLATSGDFDGEDEPPPSQTSPDSLPSLSNTTLVACKSIFVCFVSCRNRSIATCFSSSILCFSITIFCLSTSHCCLSFSRVSCNNSSSCCSKVKWPDGTLKVCTACGSSDCLITSITLPNQLYLYQSLHITFTFITKTTHINVILLSKLQQLVFSTTVQKLLTWWNNKIPFACHRELQIHQAQKMKYATGSRKQQNHQTVISRSSNGTQTHYKCPPH